ncbi:MULTISPECIES: hypothetical protein [Bacillaceae]|uniref:hypothetical protein n=1 Tax=Bacillaceae TaxID=186817 RepID=UPI000BF78A11|nr:MULTISPECIES: hypothetical protein [Bacillaceae]PEZ83299.1 hypothetical protein CN380_02740 [Bacillus sp. AFS017274]
MKLNELLKNTMSVVINTIGTKENGPGTIPGPLIIFIGTFLYCPKNGVQFILKGFLGSVNKCTNARLLA